MQHKINTQKKVVYVALNFQTGLTDLTLVVRKPDGTTLDPIIMSEQGDGVYVATYTPDALGIWQEKITSETNGDKAIRSYEVVSSSIDDVSSELNTLSTKADNIYNDTQSILSDTSQIKSDTAQIKSDVQYIKTHMPPRGGYFA
jgi:uncharacterized protein YaeQ